MNFWSSPTLSSLHAHASARFQVHPPIQLQPSPVFVLEFFEQAHLHLSKQPIVKTSENRDTHLVANDPPTVPQAVPSRLQL